MNQVVTPAIILSRTDYGEADRILTMLTPEHGKLRLLAKGVRRVKSKLAGGIELFSVSTITYIQGRSELGTLVSTRLNKHYGHIVEDIDRTMLGYELIKQLNRITEDQAESSYFTLLEKIFESLDDFTVTLSLVNLWFQMQLLQFGGHAPNLETDTDNMRLSVDARYSFTFDDMCFYQASEGQFVAKHIKFLRLGFAGTSPRALQQVQGAGELVAELTPLVGTMLRTYLQV